MGRTPVISIPTMLHLHYHHFQKLISGSGIIYTSHGENPIIINDYHHHFQEFLEVVKADFTDVGNVFHVIVFRVCT